MRRLVLPLLLAACASPDHAFWGADEQRVSVDGCDYVVFTDRDADPPRVQVIRMGYARRDQHAAIIPALRQAAELASGCDLRESTVEGDTGVMTARLSCD